MPRPAASPVRARAGRILLAALAMAAFTPRATPAQALVLLRGGLTNSDGDMVKSFPTYGLRVERALGRFGVVDGGVQYAPVRMWSGTRGYAAPRHSADLQVQLQAPLGPFRPYAGVGLGTFTYRRRDARHAAATRLVGTARVAAAGLRVDFTRHLTGRIELKMRADQPSFGYFAVDGEWALGLGIRR